MDEIETILCKLYKCDRSGLYLGRGESALSARQLSRLENILSKRVRGEPLQYLIKDVAFYGCRLRVTPAVLIPRPETEVLVEEALLWMALQKRRLRVLDIGTGSGNIAIALAASPLSKDLDIFSVDISEDCLAIARSNARLNRVGDKITYLKSDIFSAFKKGEVFDGIVSNPPYVSPEEYAALPDDVKKEPELALVASQKGFYFYKRIEKEARRHLVSGGRIFLEIGHGQAVKIKKIFGDRSLWSDVRFVKDLGGLDRVVLVTKRGAEKRQHLWIN
jgi:release factor glutamine methyltransferase